ncbi:serine--tRNA ligase [Patescibacteria group bacterium]|nr:serine--tRNA ligase [Patescibacteria group bacterium]
MLDRKDIYQRPNHYKQELSKKVTDKGQLEANIESIVMFCNEIAGFEQQIQEYNRKKNEISTLVKQKKITPDEAREQAAAIGDIAPIEAGVRDLRARLTQVLLGIPNLPLPDTPVGGKEVNVVLRQHGSKPEFDFETQDHVQLAESLGLIDYERGRKLSGKGFPVYTERGAYLQRAIIQHCIDYHHANGYKLLAIPHILNQECGTGAGQFPKFADGVFHVARGSHEEMEKFLIPTAETAIANLYSGEMLSRDQLPIKHFAESSCFRNERASHADERGIARTSEFKKVEMFQIVHPDTSLQTLDEMIGDVEQLVQGLGLHYQVSRLGTLDCSASMQATYDVEVWVPSMGIYKEVSSASLAGDYQARRTNTKFKDVDGKKKYPHFLNASGLAVPRVFMAILEQGQQKDGSVVLPSALRQYMYDNEIIEPIT